jgi:hypothetical protein
VTLQLPRRHPESVTYEPTPPQQGQPQPYPPQGYGPPPPYGQPNYPPPEPYGSYPTPPKKKSKLPLILGLAAALLVVCCGGTIIAAALTAKTKPAATPGGTSSTTASPATGAAAVVAWYDSGGKKLITDLSGDFTAIQAAGTKQDVAALHTACGSLQTHVEAAQAYTHIPDTQAETSWAQALALYARAATDCLSGTTSLNAALVTQSGQELQQGTSALSQVTARMQQLGG